MLNAKMICGMMAGLLVSTAVFAQNVKLSDINLGGGEIKAASQFKLPLDKLVPNISYDVTCKITNPTNTPVILGITGSYSYIPWLYYNGAQIQGQGPMAPGVNKVLIQYQSYDRQYSSHIVMSNADQDTKLIIDNCTAVARPKI